MSHLGLTLALAPIALALAGMASAAEPAIAWADLGRFFAPPDEFKAKLGHYRPVMRFDDGSAVQTPEDWPRRRAEIRARWHRVMGPWPPLVERPRIRFHENEHAENFTRHKVQVEFASDRFEGTQYLLVPDGQGPFAAVVVTWYNAEDSAGLGEKARDRVDFGYQLAKRGFVTLCVGSLSPGGARAAGGEGGMQPLTFLAYGAANCCNALAALPQVDPKRIGVIGHSFGGKWAMFASCLHDGFAAAVWGDPGIVWNEKDANANYWEKWYLGYDFAKAADAQRTPGIPNEGNPRTGAYARLIAEGHDLHELHALMAPRPFLVSGGAQDRPEHWTALNHIIALNDFLGYKSRVAMTMRDGHSPTIESNAQAYAFLEHFLKRE